MNLYTGKIFQSGGSQALRIPKECSFSSDVKEVYIIDKGDDKKILMQKKKNLLDFYMTSESQHTDSDFLEERDDLPPVEKDLFK